MRFDEQERLSVRFPLTIFNSKALENAVDKITGHYWNLPIDENHRWGNITEVDRRLRRRYWRMVSFAAATGAKYTLGDWHEGICSYTHLYNNVLSSGHRIAWILQPSIETKSEIDQLQNKVFETLNQVLALDNFRKDGSTNYVNVKLKIKLMPLILKLSDNDL